jgi:HD-like signal output (HDOD) protein
MPPGLSTAENLTMAPEPEKTDTWQWLAADETVPDVAAASSRESAFEFVQSLAAELSRGRVDLPTCPEVALSVHQALDGDELSNTLVTRVIAADGQLAANVLAMANVAAAARGGKPYTDLKLAVTRVGPDNVRSAALPYVLAKLQAAKSQQHLQVQLARLWESSIAVAAIARVLAARTRAAPADVALLAGLLHNLGSVYLLTRAGGHEVLFNNPAVRDVLVRDWQAQIGKAIAHNWGLADDIADAIGDQDNFDRMDAGPRNLSDVLCVAVRAASFRGRPDELEIALGSLPTFGRLGLDRGDLHDLMREAEQAIGTLRLTLGH